VSSNWPSASTRSAGSDSSNWTPPSVRTCSIGDDGSGQQTPLRCPAGHKKPVTSEGVGMDISTGPNSRVPAAWRRE
jgi:hypothetical protein